MKTQNKFWWFVTVAITAIVIALCAISLLFWQHLTPEQKKMLPALLKDNIAYLFSIVFLVFTAFGFALDWVFRFYIIPINQLAEKTELLHSVNPDLHISVEGSYDVMRLADIINQNTQQQAVFRRSVQEQLQSAKAEIEAERNILAALLEDLPQGILVCNIDGRIVFYNRKAKELLVRQTISDPCEPGGDRHWIGLGRSVFSFIDQSLIAPALDRIGRKLSNGQLTVQERFLLEARNRELLPAEIIPVLDSQHHISGFILYIEDLVDKLHKDKEASVRLQTWKHQMIQIVSVIKSTAELLNDETDDIAAECRPLIHLLTKEAALAAGLLSEGDITAQWSTNRPWPLTQVDAAEWARFLRHRAFETLQVEISMREETEKAQISVDMHHLTNSMLFVLFQIKQSTGISKMHGHLYARQSWIYFDISWQGPEIGNDLLTHWKRTLPRRGDVEFNIPLSEILDAHGARLWTIQADLIPGWSGLRLLIPFLEDARIVSVNGLGTLIPDSRPEFYDFDLFQNFNLSPELDDRLLKDLVFTAFDTETTGLDPQGGDEIISIGAVRIINGRLLRTEHFDQLVNPRRTLPWASVKFHGIRPEMLVDQPTIELVLPRFHQFAKDTVLIGHNVAFDMRMLQLKESQTQVRFLNPLLDTMLLSDVVHPAHQKHGLKAVADRLGVHITGRHTALGDAVATGEIFLKLIPLLNTQNIRTLKEARQASRKSLYARLKY